MLINDMQKSSLKGIAKHYLQIINITRIEKVNARFDSEEGEFWVWFFFFFGQNHPLNCWGVENLVGCWKIY